MNDWLRVLQTLAASPASPCGDAAAADVRHLVAYALHAVAPLLRRCPRDAATRAPRILALVDALLRHTRYAFDPASFKAAFDALRAAQGFDHREIELALPAVQIACLRELARSAATVPRVHIHTLQHTLRTTARLHQRSYAGSLFPCEAALLDDPSGVYARMDWTSRAAYRDAAATLAARVRATPEHVARAALALARAATPGTLARHVGYFLVDDGHTALRARLRGRAAPIATAPRTEWPRVIAYWTVLGAAALVPAWAVMPAFAPIDGAAFACVFLPVLLVAIERTAPPLEHLAGLFVPQRPLPSLDYVTQGIPDESRVALAIPCQIVDAAQLDRLVDVAEWNFVISNDTNVLVVLLHDHADSPDPAAGAHEAALLDTLIARVDALNAKHAPRAGAAPFVLLHRDRTWSATQRCWIGRERKRGKLEQLDALIVHGTNAFSVSRGDIARLRGARYVLCLDDDVRLGRDAAQILAGSIAHPLVAAQRDAHDCIVRGHGIIVPNGWTRRAGAAHWRVAGIVVGPQHDERDAPVAVRNFAFDLFGRNHYAGKGIYDPRVFAAACTPRMPAERVLSHDTLEAAWLRPGFAGRVTLAEGHPTTWPRLAERRHRWMRGDAQNLWLLATQRRWDRPAASGGAICAVVWFTVLTQVRLALTPGALVVAFGAALLLPAGRAWAAFGALFALLTLPAWLRLAQNVAHDRHRLPPRELVRHALRFARDLHLAQIHRIVSSPHDALLALDEFARTALRVATGRRLLQWSAAGIVEARGGDPPVATFWLRAVTPLALAAGVALAWRQRLSSAGVVLLGLWTVSPWLCLALSRAPRR